MKEVLGMTADRHPIHSGDWYWNNDYKPVKVIGIHHSERNQNTGEVVIWFSTDRYGQNFDGSRLAKYVDGKPATPKEEA